MKGKGFNFEKNLTHQTQAVESTLAVFQNIILQPALAVFKHQVNPSFDYKIDNLYPKNIVAIQQQNGIAVKAKRNSNIVDIMMETGTGKTYTYTKTIFELNKNHGIFKFIVVVPTLSIKAGTIDFLKSESSRDHFKEQYGKTIQLHIVESQKGSKNKKSFMPQAVSSYVNAGSFEKDKIQVLVINAGMINSKTLQERFDTGLFDKYRIPTEALAATNSFMIIDEPHKFSQSNKTWQNIQLMKPQFILRYGATFKENENLIYQLTAVDSFNRNLVKGVIGHITEFESGKNAMVRFVNSDGKEASVQLIENDKTQTFKIAQKDNLSRIHPQMEDLFVERLNKSTLVLSNGIELKKGDKINPYSYAQTLQELMVKKALQNHFELERKFLTRKVKIKPITLFFIDNIDEYRDEEGQLRKIVEELIIVEANRLLEKENNLFYKEYLKKTIADISLTHAGYFSKDNTDKDEKIEKEIQEILHDKQAILDLDNPRRFIFSKWTLREGWDNPNVFQICKLRSSGSEISKLQEVGRGLRLPVNEYNNRVKDEQFYLNYYVDFTESDFIDNLVNEINEKSGTFSREEIPTELTKQMIGEICSAYGKTEEELLEELDGKNLITRTNKFKEGGFAYIKTHYPNIFGGVASNKIRKSTDERKKVNVRTEKYQELKALWERLNEKVILEYKFKDESVFKKLLTDYFVHNADRLISEGVNIRTATLGIEDDKAVLREGDSIYSRDLARIATMKYSEFLKQLSQALVVNIATLNEAIKASKIDINAYLNPTTIRVIKTEFEYYLMANALDKFSVEYKKISNEIHPTILTNEKGEVVKEISASGVGIMPSEIKVASSFLFEELYYDSELEKENIASELKEVVVFTKIPKNSIKIPVAGGKSYSPDFAYVLKYNNGEKKLHFIVETKGVDGSRALRDEERFKIKHAEKFFDGKVNIHFETQFNNDKVVDLIRGIVGK